MSFHIALIEFADLHLVELILFLSQYCNLWCDTEQIRCSIQLQKNLRITLFKKLFLPKLCKLQKCENADISVRFHRISLLFTVPHEMVGGIFFRATGITGHTIRLNLHCNFDSITRFDKLIKHIKKL